MDIVIWLWLLFIGLVAGTIGSLIGLGGGIIIVPALLLLGESVPAFAGITPAVAVGTSLVLVILTALSSTAAYAKKGRVDFHSGWFYFVACGPAAMLGAYIAKFFRMDAFFICFGILMFVVALLMFVKENLPKIKVHFDVKRTMTDASGETYTFGYHRIIALMISCLIGLISGLFGIGGGSILVPLMIILFAYPPHIATATSMFIILLTSITGSFTHFVQGNIDWSAVFCLAPGAWLGGKCGVWISSKLTGARLFNLLRFAFLLIAFQMIIKGFHLI